MGGRRKRSDEENAMKRRGGVLLARCEFPVI